ncbi:hypothetical protein [Flavobacterium branchiophilum]|nr:hypothetical protein [Flavobacterium branchiophilum]
MKQKLSLLMLFVSTILLAQNKMATSIDATQKKIGAQFNITLKTTVDTGTVVVFPKDKKWGSFEIIRVYVTDTIQKDAQYELIKKYGLTQFDSGQYVIPKMKVLINNKPFWTDSLKVKVADVVVDTLKQKMFDIKPIASPESNNKNWWKWLLGLLLIGGIVAAVYYFIKKKQAQKLENVGYASPIEKAIGELKLLEKKGLWQKGEIKTHYSELTDIAREYIEEVMEIPAKESTTAELILALKKETKTKKLALSKETILGLEKVLKQADLVKFAKVLPDDDFITADQQRIENVIIAVHQSIPTETPSETDHLDNNIQKEKLQRKQKIKRIVISALVAIMLLFVTTIYFIATRGFDYVKDNVIGHPTKELLDGQWVYSEYGIGNVGLETPKVLQRMDISKLIPKEVLAITKDGSMFGYGSLLDSFYVLVTSTAYKQETEMDLKKAIEGTLQSWQAVGAQNIVQNQEDFQTKQGVQGVKATGTMEVMDPVSKQKQNTIFEIIVFKENGGFQQVVIVHKGGDMYGNQIANRIIESIEIKNTKS